MGEIAGHIVTSLGADALLLRSVRCEERLGEPFTVTCEVLSADPVDFGPLLGGGVSLTVDGDALVGRAFHGVLTAAARQAEDATAVRYRLTLRPWFWLLSLGRDSRIFQAQSAMAIIQAVFTAAGVGAGAYLSRVASAGSTVRDYCVQYEESDFAFVSRLMEEEGIYYFFQHTADKHVMVLCDGKSSHESFAGGDLPLLRSGQASTHTGAHLWRWDEQVSSAPDAVVLRDYNFTTPDADLTAKEVASPASPVKGEVFHFPGRYDTATAGAALAQLRLQAAQAERLSFHGAGDVFAAPVGSLVTVQPYSRQGGDPATVLVTGAVHTFEGQTQLAGGDGLALQVRVALECAPSAVVWRPPQRTPRPLAKGPQTAKVVGPAGEVIHTDVHGRVRVQFPWDRLGKNDEKAGCWIRVSQGWADGGFGAVHIPRIGEEVIVSYLDGDMDRPFVSGRVYNADKTPPYALPDNKTQSGWKSQTVGESGQYPNTVDAPAGSTKGFNEIRMEDKGGSEEIYVHAQRLFTGWYRFDETRTTGRNTTVKVGYNRDVTIKNNETKTVQEGNEVHTVSQGNLTTTVSQGDETREVSAGKRTTTVQGNDALTVSSGNLSTDVSLGNITVKADMGAISIEAMQKIELKVGANSVLIDMTGVTIKGLMVTSQAETIHKVSGNATTIITGGLVMIN